MIRIETLVARGSLAVFVLLIAFVLLVQTWGMPNVLSCVPPETESHTPAMSVEVTTGRKVRIVERHLFGCTFYHYAAGPQD